jgi:hypothetical protein
VAKVDAMNDPDVYKTQTITDNNSPQWGETFEWKRAAEPFLASDALCFALFDYDEDAHPNPNPNPNPSPV